MTLPTRDLVVVGAHPDDETLGCGGLIHAMAAAGRDVCVVLASDGEAADPALGNEGRARLAHTRVAESTRAVRELAPDATVVRLHLPDSALADHEVALAAALAPLCSSATLLLAPHPRDLHPDHEAVGRAARDVAAVVGCAHLMYGIWMWEWPRDDAQYIWDLARSFVVAPDSLRAKQRAMAHYASQTAQRSTSGPVVSVSLRNRLLEPTETYFVGAQP